MSAAARSAIDMLREEYAEQELDHDRTPTSEGLTTWLAEQVQALRAEIAQLRTDLVLTGDEAQQARDDLTDLRTEATAEVAWIGARLKALHRRLTFDDTTGVPDDTATHTPCAAQLPSQGLFRCRAPASQGVHRCTLTTPHTGRDHACACGAAFTIADASPAWATGSPEPPDGR